MLVLVGMGQPDGEKTGFTHFSWTRDSLYGDKNYRHSYGQYVRNMKRHKQTGQQDKYKIQSYSHLFSNFLGVRFTMV